MKHQIEALHRLKMQDHKMLLVERRLAAIPVRLTEMDKDLASLEHMLASERAKLGESRSFQTEQDHQLQDEQDQIRQSKARLGVVKTSRELAATQRELDSTRRLAQAREEELHRIRDAIGLAEGRIATLQGELDTLRTQFSDERTRLDGERKKLEALLAKTQSTRNQLTKDVDVPLLRIYERTRQHGNGVGFAPVRERRCLACKMHVAHQTYVSLRKAEDIPRCENCGRLLYWIGHFPAELEKLGGKDAAPAATDAKPKKKRSPRKKTATPAPEADIEGTGPDLPLGENAAS
jgi:hypothetical protein